MQPSVLAIAAHPDDIEFVMAGTMLQLAAVGWKLHYFNIANGCCGSKNLDASTCASVRLKEAASAAQAMPAEFYPPICDDLQIFYDHATHAKVASVIRQVQPSIVLTHAPLDYMEDHQNTARLAVGGAFARGMPNFDTVPAAAAYDADIAVYHAQPHGNRDPLGTLVVPTYFVDVSDQMPKKRELLACHASQDQWLDESQGMSSYLQTMVDLNHEVGTLSAQFEFAEGWRRHLHYGLADANYDPLRAALGDQLAIRA